MKRRAFLGGIGGALAGPLVARAQVTTRRPKIVYLAGISSAALLRSTTRRGFLHGLHDHGLVDGQNVDIDYRFADGNLGRLPALAEESVRSKPDIILAPSQAVAIAARKATSTIPIICPLLDDPEAKGLSVSNARPAGNVTGILRYVDGLASKRVEIAKELVPGVTKLGILIGPGSGAQYRDMEIGIRAVGVAPVTMQAQALGEVERALTSLISSGVQALMIPGDSLFFAAHQRISAHATSARVPTIWTAREMVLGGGLISYGVDESESFRRAGYYVSKILAGTSPGDLPIELPTKFELVINLATAKAIGLGIPEAFLLRADEVIE